MDTTNLSDKDIKELFTGSFRKDLGNIYICRNCKVVLKNRAGCNEHFKEGCPSKNNSTPTILEPETNEVPLLTYDFFEYISRRLIKLQDESDLKIENLTVKLKELSRQLDLQKEMTKAAQNQLDTFRTTHILSDELREVKREYDNQKST